MIPRGFLTLLSGSGLAQLITILALPILGRLYDPTAFGQLAAVMVLVSLATVLVHGRYHLAIPVAKSDEDSWHLLIFSLLTSAILSLPVVCIYFAFMGGLPDGMTLLTLLLSASLITFLSAMIDILAYWRSYRGRFKVSAQNSIARSSITALTQIGLAAFSSAGLLIGTGLGALASASLALWDLIKDRKKWLSFPSIKELVDIGAKYRSYPLFGVPQGWLAAVSWNLMPLLLLRFGGTAIAGQYWIAYRVLVAPISLFGGTYRQSTLPLLRGQKDETAKALIIRHTLWIAAASIIPLMVLFLFGEQLFVVALGPVWAPAGIMAGWLCIGMFADLFKVPTLCLLQSQSRQQRILTWEAIIIFLRYSVSLSYLINGDSIGAVAIFSCTGLFGWFVCCLYELKVQTPDAISNGDQ